MNDPQKKYRRNRVKKSYIVISNEDYDTRDTNTAVELWLKFLKIDQK